MIAQSPLLSGELHYARIPRAYWRDRLDMAYAMGLDAISTYVFWNVHEPAPGHFDFEGENDVAHFVRQAAEAGLDVVLRPGPYVCAEWDFGGLPAWLLAGPPIAVRTCDTRYMAPVRRWLQRLGTELAPLQQSRGGPIVAVQLENEYGAFGSDAGYLRAMQAALDDAGFAESPYYTIDQPQDLAAGSLPGVPAGVTFAPGNPAREFAALRALRPNQRPICGEYWAGWFDHWGEPRQARDAGLQVRELEWMIRAKCAVNIYMFHGGTTFGFYNGANLSEMGSYQPDVTSYDYLAALDEAGRPAPKYAAFRDAIARATGKAMRPVPAAPETVDVPPFAFTECAALEPLCASAVTSPRPLPMEELGQAFGFIRYRTRLRQGGSGRLEIEDLRDFATICVDGVAAGYLDRRLGQSALQLELPPDGGVLDVLVENCGRVNYGPAFGSERKGITRAVRWNGVEVLDWEIAPLPFDDLTPLAFGAEPCRAPAFFRGHFELAQPRPTFLDTRGLGKGVLFVNGRNAGRYWNAGPQRSLYVPGVWLHSGRNEVVVFDVLVAPKMFTGGSAEPIMEI
jgi:beta-galactosidase